MIGVVAKNNEGRAIEEFFQLFKTPWEFYVPNRSYDAVIVTSSDIPANKGIGILLVYNSRATSLDPGFGAALQLNETCNWLEWGGLEFPIYGESLSLSAAGRPFLRRRGKSEIIGLEVSGTERGTVRIGYDLFQEVSHLLSKGQPPENAYVPTLEIHISLLRSILASSGVSFVEVPPVPAGYDFMACLTHDVDFTGIRRHMFDHTMWGFLYRASVGSLLDACNGRLAWPKLLQNWKAVVSLPFVFLGLQEDFWLEFDRFLKIERGLGSTFFLIPFKDTPGIQDSGPAPMRRAVKYDVTEIKGQVQDLLDHNCEMGLHGIDAWQNSTSARAESRRVSEVTGQSEVGVRMHWLYFDESSPKALEEAGLSYDSTFGYNDAVGFRGGTTQAFCPLTAKYLLELPLNIQDTAMFYPRRMRLSETDALKSCKRLIQVTSTIGGALTINWHTRSLSPERLWGDFYAELLNEMRKYRVWFGTARQIVTWFRERRALRFEQVEFDGGNLHVRIVGPVPSDRPSFTVRVYRPGPMSAADGTIPFLLSNQSDRHWNGEAELTIEASDQIESSLL